MKIFKFPKKNEWETLLKRPTFEAIGLQKTVRTVLDAVKMEGDKAIRQFTEQFDRVKLTKIEVSPEEFETANEILDDSLKNAIQIAANNIRTFHEAQRESIKIIETTQGVSCWRKSVGIDRVGLYIPGGTAPLFSTVLMLGIPAQLAGCGEVVLCTPPQYPDGNVHPAMLFAAQTVGIHRVFKVGGVQAIGAMTYGTATIPKVYKIFGPGNQYVTAAKQIVSTEGGVAIDMPAGPSEVLVIADSSARPDFVAADLLSQAEHGADSQVVLIAFSGIFIEKVLLEIELQLKRLPRMDYAQKALKNSIAIVVQDMQTAIDMSNAYAPEHLILSVENAENWANKVTNAGSVFLGNYSPESVGDYASGTNHTLPTNGYARTYSGVSLDSFVKKITFQRLSLEGLRSLAPTVVAMAQAEQLEAHAQALKIRL
jgi:histidinol dehydrogenase